MHHCRIMSINYDILGHTGQHSPGLVIGLGQFGRAHNTVLQSTYMHHNLRISACMVTCTCLAALSWQLYWIGTQGTLTPHQ